MPPTGGFKLLDTAEVKMAFSGYTMFLSGNNLLQGPSPSSSPASQQSGGGWFSSKKESGRTPALAANEARSSDRANLNTNYINTVALVLPTQVAPSGPTSSSSSSSSSSSNSSGTDGGKYDPEIVIAARTHRLNRDVSALGEVWSLQSPANSSTSNAASAAASASLPTKKPATTATDKNSASSNTASRRSSESLPCAKVRDVETLVLSPPAVVAIGLYNNIATLFGFVDPASPHPKATSEFQTGVSDSEKLVPLQSVRFAIRCTAFTTFTTHVDFSVAHGLCRPPPTPSTSSQCGDESSSCGGGGGGGVRQQQQQHAAGPFVPCAELWTVFGFGSGDIIIWSHAQEAMLKRHNNSTTIHRDNAKKSSSSSEAAAGGGGSSSSSSSPAGGGGTSSGSNSSSNNTKPTASFNVEPGVAVSAIARVDRGTIESPNCMKWKRATDYNSNNGNNSQQQYGSSTLLSTSSSSSSSSSLSSPNSFNSQVTSFCDLVVGYENGTLLVISLNATGGHVNHKLSGWFGFSAIRSIKPCPIAPHLLAIGSDDGALRFVHFPWSFDVKFFENNFKPSVLSTTAQQQLTVADIGTARDPRVLCLVPGAVSGGGITCCSWSCNGEAVVCTGEDDAVSVISIGCSPPLMSLAAQQRETGSHDYLLAALSQSQRAIQERTTPGTMSAASASASGGTTAPPLGVHPLTIHRRHFHKSWISANMILSLDVVNTDQATDLPETRKVTAVYTTSLDGAVVAGAAFPASELAIPRSGGIAVMEKHNSFAANLAPSGMPTTTAKTTTTTRGQQGRVASPSSSSLASGGLGIRQRPLARFLQMARSDTVLSFAPIGEYQFDHCPCLSSSPASSPLPTPMAKKLQHQQPHLATATSAGDGSATTPAPVGSSSQRKRSFVTMTAKGTVALWIFYDILVEGEIS